MLLRVTHLLTYSKHKQCHHQDTTSDMQQHNIRTTKNQVGIILLLNCHYMSANNYCSALY